jgi:hypothetical protein
MVHELKTIPKYFEDVKKGKKTFEVRRNDRDFKVGDFLALNEWNNGEYTDNFAICEITYILNDPTYCKAGYVILGIKRRDLP